MRIAKRIVGLLAIIAAEFCAGVCVFELNRHETAWALVEALCVAVNTHTAYRTLTS